MRHALAPTLHPLHKPRWTRRRGSRRERRPQNSKWLRKMRMDRFNGRTAFITGGAQGIGLGIARALAREGVKLAIADVNTEALKWAQDELSTLTQVEVFELDVRDRDRYAAIADETERRLGPVSLLFNNAGVAGGASVTQMTYEMWDWVLGVNVMGVVNGVQTFLPRMLERGGDAHIVNTASGAGLVVIGSGVMYNTSKFAVVGMSEALRNALSRRDIGVSVLCPAFVTTDIAENSAALSPVGRAPTDERTSAKREESKARGSSIDAVGELVLEAIRAGRLYIYTDDQIGPHLEQRHQVLLEALAAAPHR
ncbi:SDR family NAD(P)-dependent oxidoreductase [Caulobacter sp. KR2-114]|uniref:SDR family NAD(P)-dependent oxidoreductase n=1 Tax=Caulobacter sp. KR2-114 TaxID=3400912 RepID=UPI003BFD521A